MSSRSLIGNVGQASFETDEDQMQFSVQSNTVLELRNDSVEIPLLAATDGLVNSVQGVLGIDSAIKPSVDALAARVTTNEADIVAIDIRVTDNDVELADHELRIIELEEEPAFSVAPLTLDAANNRVGVNISPSTSLHVNGTARISGNTDVLGNFAIGIAATTGPVRLNVNGLSSFRGASFLGGVSITGNLSVDDDIIAFGAVRTPDVYTNNIKPPEVLTIDGDLHVGSNCYLGDYSTGSFACIRNKATASVESDYALLQDTSGRTILNCSSGQTLELRQNNNIRMSLLSNGHINIAGNLNVVGQLTGSSNLMRFPGDASGAINRTQITAGTNTDRFIRFRSGGGSPNGIAGVQFSHFDNPNFYIFTTGLGLEIYQNTTNSSTKGQFGDRLITLSPGGNLGINVSSPTQRLHVDGNAIITGSLSANNGFKNQFDNRELSPSDINGNEFRFGFGSYYNNNASPYADVFHLNSFSNSTGGGTNALMLNKNGFGIRQYQGTYASATNYSSNHMDAMMCKFDRPVSIIVASVINIPVNTIVNVFQLTHNIGSNWNKVISMTAMYSYNTSSAWSCAPVSSGLVSIDVGGIPYIDGLNSNYVLFRVKGVNTTTSFQLRVTVVYQDD